MMTMKPAGFGLALFAVVGSVIIGSASPAFAAAGDCAVLELGHGTVALSARAAGVDGDVCIGPNGRMVVGRGGSVTGTVRLAAGATLAGSGAAGVGTVERNADLGGPIDDVGAIERAITGLPCTQSFATLVGDTTIAGNGGINVVCVDDLVLGPGDVVMLAGGPTDVFAIVVTGRLIVAGGRVRAGGVDPARIVYDVQGQGPQVTLAGTGARDASVDGTLLALDRNVELRRARVTGGVVSERGIRLLGGSNVRCPSDSPCIPDPAILIDPRGTAARARRRRRCATRRASPAVPAPARSRSSTRRTTRCAWGRRSPARSSRRPT